MLFVRHPSCGEDCDASPDLPHIQLRRAKVPAPIPTRKVVSAHDPSARMLLTLAKTIRW